MVKVGLSFIAAYILLAGVVVLLFLFIVPVGTTKSIYGSIPSSLYGPSIRQAMVSGRFSEAGDLLARQADLAESLGLNEAMMQDLVSQTFDVVDRARNKPQFEGMVKWLERLVQISPNNFLANIMLNDAKVRSEEVVGDLKLRKIRDISPSLDIVYRTAIEQAVRLRKPNSIKMWCQLYHVSQLGVLNPDKFNPSRVKGQGLNGFFLEVVNRRGEIVAGANFGIQLNERRNYEFEVPDLPSQSHLVVQLPTVPGLKITVHNINFVTRGSTTSFLGGELLLLPKRGFILEKNQTLITSSAGETLFIYPKSGRFPASNKIVLQLKFTRLSVLNDSTCFAKYQ